MSEEFRGLRKLLRKQSALLSEVLSRQNQALDTLPKNGLNEELIRLASTFFHLEQSLSGQISGSPQHREAVSLFWLDLDRILDREDIRMIRERDVSFDPRLHRAVLAREPGAEKSVVVEILEPGFIEGGKVRRSAKVILGPEKQKQEIQEETGP